jgi:hypothetical protein
LVLISGHTTEENSEQQIAATIWDANLVGKMKMEVNYE